MTGEKKTKKIDRTSQKITFLIDYHDNIALYLYDRSNNINL